MKYLLLLPVLALILFMLFDVYQTRRLIEVGINLAEQAKPFSRAGSGAKILVIGDSTAVGTGASSSSTSLAGLLGRHYPSASIENLGVNGSRTAELIPRLEKLKERYDLMMIHIGGNDTTHFTDLKQLDADLRRVIDLAKTHTDHVVIVSTGNIGTARLLPLGTRWMFEIRTRKTRDVFKKAAADKSVTFVDLFREHAEDPFSKDPAKYYGSDSFHPSDAGYADWFGLIEQKLPKL